MSLLKHSMKFIKNYKWIQEYPYEIAFHMNKNTWCCIQIFLFGEIKYE